MSYVWASLILIGAVMLARLAGQYIDVDPTTQIVIAILIGACLIARELRQR